MTIIMSNQHYRTLAMAVCLNAMALILLLYSSTCLN